jgi:hypothetical protein
MVSWSFYLQLSHGDICIFLFGVHGHYIRICCLCLGFAIDLTQLHVMNKRNCGCFWSKMVDLCSIDGRLKLKGYQSWE